MTSTSKDPIYAGDLLVFAKTKVRNLAMAITETATPEVRAALISQLNQAIAFHQKVFNYMFSRGLYPAYDVNRLIQNDLYMANRALSMPVTM